MSHPKSEKHYKLQLESGLLTTALRSQDGRPAGGTSDSSSKAETCPEIPLIWAQCSFLKRGRT